MMKKLMILITVFTFYACSKNDDNNEQTSIDIRIDITIKDSDGVDLLNPENPNAYLEEDIYLKYLVNGEEQNVYYGHQDHPKNLFIFEHEGTYRIRVFPNTEASEEFPITYIYWSETDRDTIKCAYNRYGNSIVCDKVWFNGDLIWDSGERYIEIIK
ncbi:MULTISPECIES: hypothetical protein [Flavobacteriaceae]|uniref:hypothetical protein n=1 Tax=Flavobacteriaceae TaxID=49546 RepID=UPI00257CA68F|nr:MULTISPECIES: hypothetical protein [Flavobacteriaceae]MDX1279507.1 hypothetical protein [Oceanihabitans sediminis]|tara:strand:- start:6 stop:476 length:471 start_codon:yes stop_codon:yes gene_type:complete